MAITNTDFAISAGGAITQVGGSTVYDVLDLHQWLQDLADNPSAITVYNVVRAYVTTAMKRTTLRAGKRTITITEGVTR